MDELLQSFNRIGVRYLLIGGQAMRLFGMPRFTMDWDLFIPPNDTRNLELLNGILGEELGEPIEPLGPKGENFVQTFQSQWGVLQFHLGLPGVPPFAAAEAARVLKRTENGILVPCLSGESLLAAKRAAGRPQDAQDIEFLSELQRLGRL